MSNARNLSSLLESDGDVKTSALDNVSAPTKSTIDALGIAATSVTGSQASAIVANTSKTGITSAQASAITANTSKTGITSAQASAITANSAKVTNSDQTQSDINALGITATSVDLGNWTITESSGVMYFATLGTNKMKLDASGNLTCVGDVTASGTI